MKRFFDKSRIEKIKIFYEQHERQISVGAFMFGFAFYNLTLQRIDFWLDNLILSTYLVIAGLSITILSLFETGRLKYRFFQSYAGWLPLVMQFVFGNLFSAFTVFYLRSASFSASWFFLLFCLCSGLNFLFYNCFLLTCFLYYQQSIFISWNSAFY